MKVERMKLKDLEIGDKFYPAYQHKRAVYNDCDLDKGAVALYEVTSSCRYTARDDRTITRRCRTSNLKYVDKPAEMEVMKVFTENDF